MSSEIGTRPYRLRKRADAMEATRRRFTEAAVDLHGSVGPLTVAVKFRVPPAATVGLVGVRVTDTAVTVIVAVADFVPSATLVAVIMTLCPALIVAGAVYRPVLESAPTAGLSDQVTLVLLVPVTVAVNCWVCEAVRFTEVGPIVTTGGGGGPRV